MEFGWFHSHCLNWVYGSSLHLWLRNPATALVSALAWSYTNDFGRDAHARRLFVGAHPVRDALAVFEAKGFRPPLAGESLFSCVAKRKVTKREGHPTWRFPPIHGRKVREPGPGFSTGLLSGRKGIDIHVDARYAACRPRLTAAQGPR